MALIIENVNTGERHICNNSTEASIICGISPDTIRSYINQNSGVHKKSGWRFSRNNVNVEDLVIDEGFNPAQIKTTWIKTSKGGAEVNYSTRLESPKELIDFDKIRDKVEKHLDGRKIISPKVKVKGRKVLFFSLADFHIGAYVRNLLKTPDYDLNKLTNYLDLIAEEINNCEGSEVHIGILGDVIESFTGLNHTNSWQSLEYNMYGSNLLIVSYNILNNFLSKINNLHSMYMIAGNHDRYTAKKEESAGYVTEVLAYFIREKAKFNVLYHPMVISQDIDGINYIIAHGDKDFVKNIERVLWQFGKQGMFNVFITGHTHSRSKKEPIYGSLKLTLGADSSEYRWYCCPSLFTGNLYSEQKGWTSTAGFLGFINKYGKPMPTDYPLPDTF